MYFEAGLWHTDYKVLLDLILIMHWRKFTLEFLAGHRISKQCSSQGDRKINDMRLGIMGKCYM